RKRCAAFSAYRSDRRSARGFGADPAALAALDQAAAGWRRRFELRAPPSAEIDALAIGNALVNAFPDRIALQDDKDPRRYKLSNGRGAHLHPNTQLYGERWLVVTDLRFDERDSLILAAAPFDPDLLERDFSERFVRQRVLRWNRETRAVEAFEERRFAQLVLERRNVPARPEDAQPALLAAVRELG